jgi:hypothetical protein
MNIVDRLKDEHREILASLNDLLMAPADDAEAYSKQYLDLMIRLEAHELGEERTIYSALSTDLEVRPIALQAMEEHRLMKGLLRDLTEVEITEEVWLPKLVVANNIISLHIQIEEGNVLTLVQNTYDDTERERFDRDYMAERERTLMALRS